MIQRIQSFYLLLAVCAMVLCFMFPVATYSVDGMSAQLTLLPSQTEYNEVVVDEEGVTGGDIILPTVLGSDYFKGTPVWIAMVVAMAVATLSLVSIFMYKNRMNQVKVVSVAFLLNVVYIFLIFVWLVDAACENQNIVAVMGGVPAVGYGVGTWAAAVSAVLLFLSQRAIKKDEAKVRAADRLR